MSWEAPSFAVLALVLLVGFGWYERSRPSARVLSLVAALAALAVVGRLAFAAIPNVKPTTDIVLLSGQALGAVPGFAVGAVTALVSNVFLGQGPWTPWQMAAWGLVGVGGGLLAWALRGRELGRLGLALVCGAAGFAFGALMDVYQWTFAAEQTLDSYLVVSASSLPYNAAHAIGNVVFCLLFGPAFVRAVTRYRRRFEVRWRAPAPAVASLVAACVALVAAPAALAATAEERGLRYLERAQNSDGGFGGAPRQGSSQLHTGWAALGAAAAGRNPRDLARGRRSAVDYIRSHARELNDTGELERTIIVLRAAGLPAGRLEGRNLLAQLLRHRGRDGAFDRQVAFTAFGVFALRAAGERAGSRRMRGSARYLERSRASDGGWGVTPGDASDVDDTGAVLQALAAAGRRRSAAVRAGVRYLRRAQNADGGFGQRPGRDSNAQSTAWAVQGLVAVGRDPERLRRGSRTPLAYLRSLQAPDGSFRYSRTGSQTPVWVTAQALTALARRPLPIAPVARSTRGAVAGATGSASTPAGGSPASGSAAGGGSGTSGSAGGGSAAGDGPSDPTEPGPAGAPQSSDLIGPPAPPEPSALTLIPVAGDLLEHRAPSPWLVALVLGGALALLLGGRRLWARRRGGGAAPPV